MLADARVFATAAYSATPSTSRTSRVEPPLHATSRRRTPRTRRASVSEARASAVSLGVVVAGVGAGSATSSGASDIGQPVAHAAHRLDPAAGLAELGPQVVHVRVDSVRRHSHRERPRLVEQLVPCQRLAGMAQEAFEQRELARAEVDEAPLDGHAPAALIEGDR